MSNLRTGLIAAFVICVGASFAIGRESKSLDYDAAYIPQHLKVLGEQAKRETVGGVLLIGDSISERSGIHQVCGTEVFNAGVSGATLADVADRSVQLARDLKPTRIFIALGTNDAQEKVMTDPAEWAAQYAVLVRKFRPIPVVVVPASVIQPGKRFSSYFNEAHLRELNAKLPTIAAATGAKLLSRPSIDTADGVHPTREGATAWRTELNAGCSA